MRPLLLAASLVLGVLAIIYTPATQARGKVYVELGFGTPYPYYGQGYGYQGQPYPYRGRGYRPHDAVWVPGHWAWDGYRHVWVEGYAVPVRRAYRDAPRYRQAPPYYYAPPYPRYYGPDLRFRVGYRD